MIIDETPLLGRVTVETGVWNGSTFVWTDQTSTIVQASYQEGGRLGTPGASMVDTGTLAVVYRDMTPVPGVGALIRIRRAGTTEYAFTGYIQDIASKVTYDFSLSTTPITFTTLYCLDWVGLASQFQLLGIGGKETDGSNAVNDNLHFLDDRVRAINRFIDPSGATVFVTNIVSVGLGRQINDTDLIGTIPNHLDIAAISAGAYWNATHVLPTNPTTGRDGLLEIYRTTSTGASGKTFTDGAGLAGELHYTEIDLENSSANIANSIVLRNLSRYSPREAEVLTVGGVDEKNFVEIDGQQRAGFMLETSWKEEDATSIATYGLRQTEIETCVATATDLIFPTENNLISNPSAEYTGEGYFGSSAAKTRRVKPANDPNPFIPPAGLGEYSVRTILRTANATPPIVFEGTVSDGIIAFAGSEYMFSLYAYRGIPNRTDVRVRARIQWIDANDDVISTVLGAQVSCPAATWVQANSGRVTAPSGTVRLTVAADFNRSGGGNFSVGDRLWADGFSLYKYGPNPNTVPAYFDGDTPDTSTHVHLWTGSPGASASYREPNKIDETANSVLAQYANTSNRATRIRWNAQENLTAVAELRVGRSVIVKNNGTTGTYRIIGIDGNLTRSRYVIDYYLVKI